MRSTVKIFADSILSERSRVSWREERFVSSELRSKKIFTCEQIRQNHKFTSMISYLEGTIKFKSTNYLTILVGGVGYKVSVPADIIAHTKLNQSLSLFIHTHVKEDALDLYGFETPDELAMFELLLSVSGIGPKTALSIFSNGKLPKIKEAIIKGDVSFFTSVPRLGTKNSQKIIIELRSKLGNLGLLDLGADSGETKEIIDALKSFGFTPAESREAIKSLKDSEGSVSDKIRQSLKYLGKKT